MMKNETLHSHVFTISSSGLPAVISFSRTTNLKVTKRSF